MVNTQAVVDAMARAIGRDIVSALTMATADIITLRLAMLLETNLSYAF